ncbi:hypothetical protein AMECASPLE_019801 [Ameca splendens]|uniref:Uncharacterized protein n=1 Tax=Ameca splendens TaxID=208324 RepID=A0ABV0XS99_9TELE
MKAYCCWQEWSPGGVVSSWMEGPCFQKSSSLFSTVTTLLLVQRHPTTSSLFNLVSPGSSSSESKEGN